MDAVGAAFWFGRVTVTLIDAEPVAIRGGENDGVSSRAEGRVYGRPRADLASQV